MPSMRALLTDPDRFFAERVDDPSYRGPVVVVTVLALVTSFSLVVQYRAMYPIFDSLGLPDAAVTGFLAVSFAFALVGPYVRWLLWAGGLQLVSVFLNSDGEFSTTLALAGWGFVPAIAGGVAQFAINYYRFRVRGVDVPENVDPESMAQFSRRVAQGELAVAATLVGVLFTLWSAYIWFHAVRHARSLDNRDAAVTVGVPLLVSLAFSAFGLVTSFGAV